MVWKIELAVKYDAQTESVGYRRPWDIILYDPVFAVKVYFSSIFVDF